MVEPRRREVADPVPGPNEVLIEVGGCGLNHLDVWAVKSPRDHRRGEPRIPGADIAGVVKALGLGVNWYLTKQVKVSVNYEHTTFAGGAADGADRPSEDFVVTRFQHSF